MSESDEEWTSYLADIDRRAAELGGYDELIMADLGITRDELEAATERVIARFKQKRKESEMLEELSRDLSRVGLSFVEYQNPTEVGYRGWVEAPSGVVAFVGNDGALVWHW